MHVFTLAILFLFSNSSFAKMNVDGLRLRLLSTYKVELSKNYKEDKLIETPSSAHVVLAELEFFNKAFKRQKDCVVYKIPAKNSAGELSFIRGNAGESCDTRLLASPYFQISNIFNLSYSLTQRQLVFKIDKKKLTLNFYNLRLEDLKTDAAYNTKVPGIQISFVEPVNMKGNELEELELCQDVSSDCSDIKENFCHLCPSNQASYMVYASNCSANPIRRYCGNVKCGVSGNPACIRGRKASGYTGDYCIADSPLGFCTAPARVICLNGELYCE